MTLRSLDEAKEELRESARWYEEKQRGLGDDFLTIVERAFETIERHPRRFTKLATQYPDRDTRRCVLKRFPFVIIYENTPAETLVVAIAHAKRNPGSWQSRLDP